MLQRIINKLVSRYLDDSVSRTKQDEAAVQLVVRKVRTNSLFVIAITKTHSTTIY